MQKLKRKQEREQLAGKGEAQRAQSSTPAGAPKEVTFTFLEEAVDPSQLLQEAETDPYLLCDTDDEDPHLALAAMPAKRPDAFLEETPASRGGEFILDTGASRHVVFNAELLENVRDIEPFHLFTATGHHTVIRRQGAVRLSKDVVIGNVCHVPRATHNLLSLSTLLDAGAYVSKINAHQIVVSKSAGTGEDRVTVNLSFKRAEKSGVWKLNLPSEIRQRVQAHTESFKIQRLPRAPGGAQAPTVQRRPIPKKKGTQPPPASSSIAPLAAAPAARSISDEAQLFILADPAVGDRLLAFHERETDAARLWHVRLGHQSAAVLSAANRLFGLGIPKRSLQGLANCVCDSCILGKGRRAQIGSAANPAWAATETMDCIHLDLIGPMSVYDGAHKNRAPSLGGAIYALVITDEYSRAVAVYLLKHKSDAAERIIALIKLWQSHTGKRLKRAHSDGAGEFVNDELKSFLEQNGTRFTYTTTDTPQHNGIAERKNGMLIEITRTMLAHAGAPISLWGEALTYAAFIHNNTPQPSIQGRVPFAVLFNRHYEPTKLRVFGCDALIYLDEDERGKFESRFKHGVFVGYDQTRNGFRVLDPESRRVTVSRNVKMLESNFEQVRSFTSSRSHAALEFPLYVPIMAQPQQIREPPADTSAPQTQVDESDSERRDGMPEDSPLSIGDDEPENDAVSQNASSAPEPGVPPKAESPASSAASTVANPRAESAAAPQAPPPPRISREAAALQKQFSQWKEKPALQVPPRTKVGLNAVTYGAGAGRVRITEAEPSVSSRGRVSIPVHSKRTFLFLEDPDVKDALAALVSEGNEPRTYKQALRCADAPKWESAMKEELASLERLGTWQIVPRPKNARPITARWVYKLKLGSDNQPVRYKARLVARGFQQTHGVDYDETFAPVVKLKSLKLVLALAAAQDLEVKQIDFDTAFLNAELSHEVYMELPEGSNYPPGTVCKLLKSIYGLKQAGHDWHVALRELLLELGYQQLECDKCVFIKRTKDGRMIILPLYVDDTLAVYHKADETIWLADKTRIAKRYAIKDIGDCEWILNMKVTRDRQARTLTLSQEAYIRRVLETFQHDQCKPLSNPSVDADLFAPPAGTDETPLDKRQQTHYQSIVGSLLYAALTTRPDIAYAVNELGRFNAQATQFHLTAAHHVLRYLAGTANRGLSFSLHGSPTDIKPEIFVDASWANDLETRRSTSGLVVKLNGNVVAWASKKQKTVALSSTEAEYMAASEAACEALWLRTWIHEVFRVEVPVAIHCDNQSAIALSKNDTFHQRTKHIDNRYHFIRERVAWGHIKLQFIPTEQQEADILTKRFSNGRRFALLRDRLMTTV
jgi:Reverse transcriptase (RNA-dependent DNA polymerase)/Pol polyprotein, beta-barrel domain/Integrase core domain